MERREAVAVDKVRVFLTGVAEWERVDFFWVSLDFKDSLFDLLGAFLPALGEVGEFSVGGGDCWTAVDSSVATWAGW